MLAKNEISEVRDKKKKTMEIGNVKAMREALLKASDVLTEAAHHNLTEEYINECLALIHAALAAPERKMKEVYAIKKTSYESHDNEDWYDIELFESEDAAVAVLSLEASKHIDDQGFSWDGKELTWTSGNWSYNWWLDKIPVVKKGSIGYRRELGRKN